MIFYKANFVVQKGEITIYSIWLGKVGFGGKTEFRLEKS